MITTICGLIDAACFLALGGVLAELMTGNLIFFAVGLGSGTASAEQLSRYVTAFVPFVIGAYLGGRILRGPAFLRERRRGFILEWLVIVLATVLTVILHPGESGYPRAIVVGLLALAMGIQNALIREHGIPNLATNVMTLTLTGLLADPRGPQAPHRKRRQFSSIAIFVVSATVGAFLVRYSVAVPLLVATFIFTLALYWLIPARGEIRTAEPVG